MPLKTTSATRPDPPDAATDQLRAAVPGLRTPTLPDRSFNAENRAIARMSRSELQTYKAALEAGDRQGQLRVVSTTVQRLSQQQRPDLPSSPVLER